MAVIGNLNDAGSELAKVGVLIVQAFRHRLRCWMVTYGVANDYFFSGHTAIAVLAGTELIRYGRKWLTVVAVVLVIFEVAVVLVLRAHYVMDVFTGLITGLYAAHLADRLTNHASF